MKKLYFSLLFLCSIFAVQAQTTIWLGGSTDWNDPANWTDGIPTTGVTVTIPQSPPNGPNFPIFDNGPLIDFSIQIFGGSLTFNSVVYNTETIINSGGGSIVSNDYFINAGMVQFNNNAGTFVNNGIVDNYGTFTNAGSSTLTNSTGSNFNNFGTLENFGLIVNDGDLFNTGEIISTSTFQNNGTLNNTGIIDAAFGSTFTNSTGAVFTGQASAICLVNGTFTNDGSITSNGSFFIQQASNFTNGGSMTSNGNFELSGDLFNNGTFGNNDFMLINDSGLFENNNTLTNNDTITLTVCGQIIQNAGNNIGEVILNDGIIYEINGTVTVTSNLDFGSVFNDLNEMKPPDTKCRSGIFVFLDSLGNGTLSPDAVDKNSFGFCGASIASKTVVPNTFTQADLGIQEVTLTITDEFGFFGTCNSFITVVDYFPPIVPVDDPDIDFACPPDITLTPQPGATSELTAWTEPTATTNCSGGGGLPACGAIPNHITGFTYLGQFNDSKYFVSNTTYFWQAAKLAAEANNGTLAIINDAAENTFIKNNISNNVWIGLTDEATEGTFQWVNGDPVTYTNWQSGEPNNSGNEDFTELKTNGFWNDRKGSTTRRYVLEISCANTTPVCADIDENISGFTYVGEFNNSKYFLSNSSSYNWANADATATANGGHLATISDAAENQFVRSNMVNGSSIWLGYSDAASEGNWEWVTGETDTYTNWINGEPNEGVNGNFARMREVNGNWTDRDGSQNYYFMMEIDCTPGVISCFNVDENITGFTFIGEMNDSKYFVSNTAASWTLAKSNAEFNGGHLAVIDDVAENNFIQNNINPASGSVWIGLNNNNNGANFQWVTGDPVTYTNWAATEPNETSNNVAVRLREDTGQWTDRVLSNQFEYVMEIPCANNTGGGNPGGGLVVQQISGGLNGSLFPVGDNEVAYQATDDCGNIDICTFTVTVESNPATITISDCPADITVNTAPGAPSAVASWTTPTATTDCFKPNAAVEQTFGPVSGSVLPIGTQSVNYTATDSCGNFALCIFSVTIAPVNAVLTLTSCPGDISVQANPGDSTAVVNWVAPTATSDCYTGNINVVQLVGPTNGSTFSFGTTQIVYVLSDDCGNSSLCAFDVTVNVSCPAVGTPCDDNDPTTENDLEDGNCNCAGTPCPIAGTACDDSDPTTENDIEDGNCNCAGTPCPVAGTTCDDGDATTENDIEDGNCNCLGTPCPVAGTTCDDGDANTENDIEDGFCNCSGTPIICPPVGTACDDGDATTENDIEDGNCNCLGTPCPVAGTTCDDGDANTENDIEDGFCNCSGTPIICPPAGTACDDGDATTENDIEDGNCNCSGTPCPVAGTTCDDGDANTENDVEDGNCNCAGTPIGGGCSTSDNLALNQPAVQSSTQQGGTADRAVDGNTGGSFFTDNSTTLTNWEAQPWWEVDLGAIADLDSVNIWNREDCCTPFLSNYYVFISSVPFASTDLTTTLNDPNVINFFEANEAGRPTSIAANVSGRYVRIQLSGVSFLGLTEVEVYGCVGGGCPAAGTACDDGNPATENDVEDGNCNCAGTPCPISGTVCDDGDANTENDIEDGFCNCAGTPISCPPDGTACDDGNPATENDVEDGNCNCAGTPCPIAGTVCDDGDANTENDVEDGFCNCAGTPIICPPTGTACDDGNPATENDVEDGNCNCAGTPCPTAGTVCDDGDANTENDVEDGFCNCAGTPIGGGCTVTENLALSGTGTSSSAQFNAVASRAIDGNTDGDFWNGNSVALTNWETQPWIEVDLGNLGNIENIKVWNRTDCCGSFLVNYYLLVSDVPFASTNLTTTLNQTGVSNYFESSVAGTPSTVSIGRTGRYVRIQLQGTSFLGLAELEIIGCFGSQGCPSPGTSCDDGNPNTQNDVEDGFCNCAGVICPTVGTACDDGNPATENDIEDGNCNCAGTPCPTAGTLCDDGNPNTENDAEDGFCNCAGTPIGGCSTPTNLALNKTATQSSTLTAGGITANPEKAIDGNTNGTFFTNPTSASSVSATNFESEAWWQVDLGTDYLIETVNAFNRTDGVDKTQNCYILISDTPFASSSLAAARAQAVYELYVPGLLGSPEVALPNVQGRYVRVQLAGSGYLVMGEVEVWGCTQQQFLAVPNMLDFNAEKVGLESYIDWTMLKDVEVDYYEVEVSTDGFQFEYLDEISAVGINSPQHYSTIDREPETGENFYRLKVVHHDGSFYYSNIRRVNFDIDFGEIIVYPNPVNDVLHIVLRDFSGKTGTVTIYNSLGQKMGGRDYQSFPSVPATFDVSKFVSGVYTISVKVENHALFTKKFIVGKL